ncbi:MFS general substrate transporter [Neoconidiobolus thromboides FSU 785]|nr:MFS general substrate transporter [Neoconidiobolus thromboides FSU 785]
MWLQCIAVILPRVKDSFSVSEYKIGLLSSSIFTGMMIGSLFWGLFSDKNGRKPAFNWTLAVAGVFGILASLAPNFISLCICLLFLGFGVGGNMPVDGALFLEFIPKESQYLLTFLSVFFSFGAAFTSFLAWVILPRYSCVNENLDNNDNSLLNCDMEKENNGWRILLFTLGMFNLFMVIARVVLFHLPESPKFLMSQNRAEEVVVVLRKIVHINGSRLSINLKDIQNDNNLDYNTISPEIEESMLETKSNHSGDSDSVNIVENRSYFDKLIPLFSRKYFKTTILVWLIWTFTSFAYTMFNVFLPSYLDMKNGSDGTKFTLAEVYFSTFIYSLSGIPGSILGSFLVETFLGRKGSMALSAFGSAFGLILFIFAKSSNLIVFSSSLISFLVTIMYAVIYAYTPEVFDTVVRGTACGTASALSRIAGIIAPLVTGGLISISLSLPNYISAIMFVFVGICMVLLPIETKGRVN